ncbi:MAG: hypothetical protein COW67_12995 [Flavobacteriales bacterium CG18_big_fil_WC_8_21_14_2_50_32_9]|nr:MAG: hypothetical protein COW67_12995 [Flavobacteriales bacterium CG18_big_fil_WC_8_21_14_2_50_32_9]PJC61482.1 MAG: hypothetical protein CO022_09625 [Flavobacteriales bacterium CG_4_9_14_0_2_um_filter_32_27]
MKLTEQDNKEVCIKCKAEIEEINKFCTSCGYPQNGSVQEKKAFRIRKQKELSKLKEIELSATVGKSVLFMLGSFYLVWAIYTNLFIYEFHILTVIIDFFEAFIYLGLWLWAKRRLLPATISGLFFYTTMFVIGLVSNPYSGLLIGFKGLFFILLVISVTSARKYEKMIKDFG